MKLRVCDVLDAPSEGYKVFEVDGLDHPILLVRLGKELHATTGICPHEDVDLDGGDLWEDKIVCPGHAYEFDIRTGQCTHDVTLCLKKFRVSIDEGIVYVQLL